MKKLSITQLIRWEDLCLELMNNVDFNNLPEEAYHIDAISDQLRRSRDLTVEVMDMGNYMFGWDAEELSPIHEFLMEVECAVIHRTVDWIARKTGADPDVLFDMVYYDRLNTDEATGSLRAFIAAYRKQLKESSE